MHLKRLLHLALTMIFLLAVASPVLAADSALDALDSRLQKLEDATGIRLGGALRVNYGLQDWSAASKDKGGDFAFDLFRLNLDGEVADILLSAEYRFYPEYDFDTIHHGWIGYNFSDDLQGQIGIQQVPFGIQPYASHNFWFSGAYYLGLEDDYDMGVKFLYTPGPLDIAVAFYKNAELGNSSDKERYSIDLITEGVNANEETNQGNLRLAYTLQHSETCATEFGWSGEYGQVYNTATGDMGDHWASAVHLVGNYGNLNVQLEYAAYEYALENPTGVDNRLIHVGAFAAAWDAPAKASIGIFNAAYTFPLDWGPLDSIQVYSDNTVIEPDEGSFGTAWQNVVGAMVAAGPLYTYFDVISGENMIFMNGNPTTPDNERNTRININFGYYF
ncbi:hypothetical protein JCM30471_30700 [Desulfuromonas carbonis]|uniref:hypothetical protein n=1 Tax=Desulfuromonas sp. DDH964 TaxID=1823759 RepID=UPI00078E7F34|nr:hypothetical protein [Desulfuromonas sp. DDH964]AMV71231.1 hypothetical protein DBW_0849 [Desulfuromonas sp. DDH964]